MNDRSWRTEPAAALRGLTNGRASAATWPSSRRAKAAALHRGYLAVHLDQRRGVGHGQSAGDGLDDTVDVTSSPTRPSPRVAALTSLPSA